MAIAYLNEGATSDAAANWSDTTGYANAATLVINSNTSQVISGGLDHSALGTGIASLDIRWPFGGSYGSEAAGPVIFDADGGSPNTVNYDARAGKFFVKAGGGSTLITNFNHTSPGAVYAQGGIFTTFGQQRGTFNANGATTLTTFGMMGGTALLDTLSSGSASTLIEMLRGPDQGGGTLRLKRDTTTLNIEAGNVTKEDGTGTTTTVNLRGGYLEWWVGTITTLNYYGGDFNPVNATRDVTVTTFNVYPGANPAVVRAIASTFSATPVYKYGGPSARGAVAKAL